MRTRSIFVAGVLTLGLVATACTIQPGGSSSSGSPAVGDAFGGATGAPLPAVDEPIEAVTQRALPAVVNVTSDVVTAQGQAGQGVGTGFIVRSDGVVVTNCHVVEGATRITVFTSAKQPEKFDARVIGGDCEHDLAVLKIDGKNLPTVPLGSSADLQLGQSVVAIGYALALEGGPSVTTGIVSSLDRVVQVQDPNCEVCQNGSRTYSNVIQTDAAINHGNSGGPLLNLQGEVVGINSAGADTAENIGFAIAIDAAKQTIQQAINEPLAATGYIGVSTQTVTADMAYQMNLTVQDGAYIIATTDGGPAADAGIESGDVITSVDGQTIHSADDLGRVLGQHQPGDTVPIVVNRDGQERSFDVTLGARPMPTQMP
jgi:S1-C subfamily serine protease